MFWRKSTVFFALKPNSASSNTGKARFLRNSAVSVDIESPKMSVFIISTPLAAVHWVTGEHFKIIMPVLLKASTKFRG